MRLPGVSAAADSRLTLISAVLNTVRLLSADLFVLLFVTVYESERAT